MQNKDKTINFFKMVRFIVIVFLLCKFCIIFLPPIIFDNNEVNNSTGNILVALKELQVLEPEKLVEFETHKKLRFTDGNTSMTLKFDYAEIEDKVQSYYVRQAKNKNWDIIKAKEDEIILEKQREENLVRLDLRKQKDKFWLMNVSIQK